MKRNNYITSLLAVAVTTVFSIFSCNLPTSMLVSIDYGNTLLVDSMNHLESDVTYTESSRIETFKSDGTYEYNVSTPTTASRKGTYTYDLETYTLSITYTQYYNTTNSSWATYPVSDKNTAKSMTVLTENKKTPAFMYDDGILTGRNTVTSTTTTTPAVTTIVDTTVGWVITATNVSNTNTVRTTVGTSAATVSTVAGITSSISSSTPSDALAKAGDAVTYTSAAGTFELTLIQGNVAIFSQELEPSLDLSALAVSTGTLSPAFSAATTAYTVIVPTTTTSVTVTGTKASSLTTVSSPVTLSSLVGGTAQVATITVTGTDATTKAYTVTVLRDSTSANIGTLKGVPTGTFQRDATSTNTCTVSTFQMSANEITRAQFTALLITDPSSTASSSGTTDPVQQATWYHAIAFCNKLSIAEGLTQVYAVSGVTFSSLTYAQIPTSSNTAWDAVTVTWTATGYRLPTEAEWMWAAMGATGGTTGYNKAFAGSTGTNLISNFAWYTTNSSSRTNPVTGKSANELGFYDLSGNVGEWTWDIYGTYPTGAQTNYRGASTGTNRVFRGGSWSEAATACTVAYRNSATPSTVISTRGFRVVRQ